MALRQQVSTVRLDFWGNLSTLPRFEHPQAGAVPPVNIGRITSDFSGCTDQLGVENVIEVLEEVESQRENRVNNFSAELCGQHFGP
jgi:hypothetical protein